MAKAFNEIKARASLEPRQNSLLLGDLKKAITTPIGQEIADILTGKAEAQVNAIPVVRRQTCDAATNVCCVWNDVSATLTEKFLGPTGRCNDNARAAVRLGFHDAGSWSQKLADAGQNFGGADGSLLMDFGEQDRDANNGLQEIRLLLRDVQAKHGVGFADLAQFAHNHATVTCPLGPRIKTYVGRPDATKAAPDGLLPSTFDTADNLLALFADKTFTAAELAALLGAHTTARQFHSIAGQEGDAQDSTPGVWDVAFYNETLQTSNDTRLTILPSDLALAKSSQMSAAFSGFIGRQGFWNARYSTAYVRMSMLGVPNINDLKECTDSLPAARPTFDFKEGEFINE
ncbi:heme peroxidase [Pseudovirgaria hyperparasitica]|uniref:Peroxidase n=1 Tax=Pseudovirgaria hyperparasitica TaxID=470096 RepID=A0A6A6VU32_9PEZI|nr:heme peroxidase [Pseudovirgaria hyperparasitica]KAF2753120.1 heme peroxidase [Pseudovirgaria hyperparasitica]